MLGRGTQAEFASHLNINASANLNYGVGSETIKVIFGNSLEIIIAYSNEV